MGFRLAINSPQLATFISTASSDFLGGLNYGFPTNQITVFIISAELPKSLWAVEGRPPLPNPSRLFLFVVTQ